MFKAYDFAIAIRRNLAAFTNKGRPYKKPKRETAKREIRRLIIDEGLTNRQISERINIPQRTVERYISELYKFDNQLLAGMNDNAIEEALTAWSICKERMAHHRQEILENIARNPNAPFKDRMAAWHIICELEAADLRLLEYAPEMVARRSALPKTSTLVVKKEGSTIVNLKLLDKRNKEEEEQEEDNSNPLAFTEEETYAKIQKDKEKIIREQEQQEEEVEDNNNPLRKTERYEKEQEETWR
jgi:hypothetical protein